MNIPSRLFTFFLPTLFLGCYTSVSTTKETVKETVNLSPILAVEKVNESPSAGKISRADVGDVVFTFTSGILDSGIILTMPALGTYSSKIDDNGSRVRDVFLAPGRYSRTFRDDSGGQYFTNVYGANATKALVINIDEEIGGAILSKSRTGNTYVKSRLPAEFEFEYYDNRFVEDSNYLRWELVFLGLSDGETLSLMYREFSVNQNDQMIRQAFSLPLTYQISPPQVIRYKDITLNIASVNQNVLEYSVLTNE